MVIGSLGLDRLLSVPRYPEADSKVRTTAYHEYGGGNSGNTASTMAKLKSAKCWSSSDPTIDCINIKLLTKVGDDIIGHQLKEELENVGVDCSSSLFCVVPNTATSFTTIIVSEEEHTRTCLHTHGTSGELTLQDVQSANLDEIFENVIHLHTDSRHTEAALAIAQEARKRGIPISIDVEKNRYSKAQDQLLELATIVFTNSYQIDDYLNYLCREKEQEARTSLQNSTATLVHPSLKDSAYTPIVKDTLIQAIQPSFYFARWHSQTSGKEVVITK